MRSNEIKKTLSSARQTIRKILINGAARPVARPLYNGLIATTLGWEQLLGHPAIAAGDQAFINDKLTAVIKTFERPKTLRRLLKSIRALYPGLRIIVVDDSKAPVESAGVETLTLPYDSGVSVGRNAALERVTTDYLLLLDDDFIFNRHTRVLPVLRKLEQHTEIDIIGGDVIYLPFYRRIDYQQATLYPTNATPVIEPGSEIGGLVIMDKVANFYIARTASLRRIRWDPLLKRMEHADFFTRAKGVLVTAFDKEFRTLHARTPFDQAYMRKRLDLDEARRVVWKKYYATAPKPDRTTK